VKLIVCCLLAVGVGAQAQVYTRGIGVYPGDPKEYMGPSLKNDATRYRNLALHRPAYQSSAYDYNLTAQLITDGIKTGATGDTALPRWIETATSDAGILPKNQREVFLDGNVTSSIDVSGEKPWVQFAMEGGSDGASAGESIPEIDRFELFLRKNYGVKGAWTCVVSGSDDGAIWKEVGRSENAEWPESKDSGPSFAVSIPFSAPVHYRQYRIQFSASSARKWGVAEVVLFDQDKEVRIAGPDGFAHALLSRAGYSSAWMSAGDGEEWVYVDLGAICKFDRVTLSWIRRASAASIQVSDDAVNWKTIYSLPNFGALVDDVPLPSAESGRYVRVRMLRSGRPGERYILSEMEVYGRGGPVVVAAPQLPAKADGSLPLARGKWRVQRASLVAGQGEQISAAGFADKDWMVATVPGTVLTSYLNDGAIANPDFGDNQFAISDAFFCADFWYRDEFPAPAARNAGNHFWLNFDGVNWKADVYLNGRKVWRIDGGYMRGRFDVTELIKPGKMNALAVRVIANANPGGTKDKSGPTVNGGALGRDNPTYHASAGWDWISTIRGRDTGIWSDVSLTQSGPVLIDDPLVTSTLPLPDISQADVTIKAGLQNLTDHAVSGQLLVSFGELSRSVPVTLEARGVTTAEVPNLHLTNPKLWWPNGYGEANLYPVTMKFVVGKRTSDAKAFQAGIRQFTYSEDGGMLKIWVNGRRFIPKGGNWGFPESMLRYRAREYEAAMEYHKDEHFNMIRNWVGQTGDEAFYAAADRNGIVVWQDFWLANPWDGPNPDDNGFFLTVAKDYLLRIRNHASLGIFCGRNEGFPPKEIDDGLRNLVAQLEPGSHYISSSADGPVSGHGPYRVQPLKDYFDKAPTKLHSEMGAPNVVSMDSLKLTMPEAAMWPQSTQWPLHDYHEHNPFTKAIEEEYGGAKTLDEWMSLAQFVDYNAYRGMFEGQSKNRMGLLIWMSHPAWPSLLWQTYDYFFDTDAAYYGAKKAAEPLHIQWNAATDDVEVVNYSAGERNGLTAKAEVIDIDGSVKWTKSADLDSHEDTTQSPMKMEFPAGLKRTHFIQLTLMRDGKTVSSNFYLHGVSDEDYAGIRGMAKAKIAATTKVMREGSQWHVDVELRNDGTVPALMVRVKAVREKTGDGILPAIYNDNYLPLMPGEQKFIHATMEDADTRGERPRVVVDGFNVSGVEMSVLDEAPVRTKAARRNR
jgi:Exo-beta-D-glucosaminidase Ig-fold domain/F5/8 type C domain/Glycosyl hydrolases family 2/Glycosyl hydrolases family 2, sugar binding domain